MFTFEVTAPKIDMRVNLALAAQDAMFNFKSRIIAALAQDTTIQEDQTND